MGGIDNISLLKKVKISQDIIFNEFKEKWDKGELNNKGEEQLKYALFYFQLEFFKRTKIKKLWKKKNAEEDL